MAGDALLALRAAISSKDFSAHTKLAIDPSDSSSESPETNDIIAATSVVITLPSSKPSTFALSAPTRFTLNDSDPVDLRSVLFAYQQRDAPPTDYLNQAEELGITKLPFGARVELMSYLETGVDSDMIKPLEAGAQKEALDGKAGGAAVLGGQVGAKEGGRQGGLFGHERRLGDRNSILRGIKPTDFSHVKKTAEIILRSNKQKPGSTTNKVAAPASNGSLPTHPKKPARRPDPIILLSPSASSLLRMSNIKRFLDEAVYTPPDANSGVGSLNHITRVLPSIDANRPLRFILVEGPDRFKSDDWKHVVAVFTTGQAWQFKGYRWTEPSELFAQVLGVYVGWKGDPVPATVKGWGRGVKGVEIDRWSGTDTGRWRDREAVEKLWSEVEEHMRRRGWSRDTGPR